MEERLLQEQKKVIGVEPSMSMSRFVILMLANLAKRTQIYDYVDRNKRTATLPFDYASIIEKIMYSDKEELINDFADLIDIAYYYSFQNDWEEEFGITLKETVTELNKKIELDLVCQQFRIAFDKDEVSEIMNQYDDISLKAMDEFVSLLSCQKYRHKAKVAEREFDRNSAKIMSEIEASKDFWFNLAIEEYEAKKAENKANRKEKINEYKSKINIFRRSK